MGAFLKLFLLALLLTTAATTASASFDFWKLALQWPPALRLQNPLALNLSRFTIHGLWPDNETGPLGNCRTQWGHGFNYQLLQGNASLITSLHRFWPDVEHGGGIGNDRVFWSHEWNKHGGCSPYNQVVYFQLGVYLYDYIFAALTQASVGLYGYNPFSLAAINNSITAAIGVPILTCDRYNGGRQALKEVHLCFERQSVVWHGVIKNCPPPPPPPPGTNLCSRRQYIYLI